MEIRRQAKEKEKKAGQILKHRAELFHEEKIEKHKVMSKLGPDTGPDERRHKASTKSHGITFYSPEKAMLELSRQVRQWDHKHAFKIEKIEASKFFDVLKAMGKGLLDAIKGAWTQLMKLLGLHKQAPSLSPSPILSDTL